MNREEFKYREAKLSLEENDREVFRRTYNPDDGVQALTWFLNECGYFSCDPAKIVPEKIALANRTLAKLGVIHELNLFEVTRKLLEAANDEDLSALRKMLQAEEVED